MINIRCRAASVVVALWSGAVGWRGCVVVAVEVEVGREEERFCCSRVPTEGTTVAGRRATFEEEDDAVIKSRYWEEMIFLF